MGVQSARSLDVSISGGALRTLGAFARDTSGATAVMIVLLIPVLIGFMGLSFDVGLWYTARRGMQNLADAAAMSGAGEIANGSADSIVKAAARSAAIENGFDPTPPATIDVNIPPDTGPSSTDNGSVEVIISRPMVLLFTEALSSIRGETFTAAATVRAVANTDFVDEFCILGLADTGTAVSVSGNGTATLDCGVAVNSTDTDDGLDVSGGGTLNISGVTTVGGGVDVENNATLVTDSPPRRGPPVVDPYKDLEIPDFTDCDRGGPLGPGDGYNTSPGDVFDPSTATTSGVFVFCGDLRVESNSTFLPGLYIIDSGNFIATGGTLTGDGVTFIVTTSSTTSTDDIGGFDIRGNADIEFSAPDTDPFGNDPGYSGVLFYQDRRVSSNLAKSNIINGGAELDFEGALYFPGGSLDFRGGSELADGCVQLIADQVTISGNTGIQGNCGNTGTRSVGRLRASLGE